MNWSPIDRSREPEEWSRQIKYVASNHTQVTGVLAGFSITVVILIASIKLSANHINDLKELVVVPTKEIYTQGVFGLFIAAFFGYVSSGILYSISIERIKEHQYLLFSMASFLYYLSVVLSFSAILPLIKLLGYSEVRLGAEIAMICAVIGGYFAAAVPIHDLLLIRPLILLWIFIISIISGVSLYITLHVWLIKLSPETLLMMSLPVSIITIGVSFMICMLSFLYMRYFSINKLYIYSGVYVFFVTALAGFYASLMLFL